MLFTVLIPSIRSKSQNIYEGIPEEQKDEAVLIPSIRSKSQNI